MTRRIQGVLVFLLAAASGVLLFAFWYTIRHALGIDTQQSMAYDFVSGSGPMFVTIIGYSTIITGFWHHVNCHEPGCWRFGRHKVNGTPWCNRHHEKARPDETVADKLDRIIALLESQGAGK